MLAERYFWITCITLSSHIMLQLSGQGSNRLKLTVLSEDRLQMKWKEAEGNTNGYKVSVKPMADDSEQEVMLKTKTAKVTVGGLSPSKEYTLQIYTLNGPQEVPFIKRKFVIEELKNLSQAKSNRKHPSSAPEKAETFLRTTAADYILETKTTLPPTIETSTQISSHFQCNASAATDIILLVDGSWSVGRPNFKLIRQFLAALVTPFNIALDKVRVGLSQYSGDVRTEWNLDTYSTKDKLLEAIGRLSLKGGNTLTGLALNYVRSHNLKPAAGARAEATKLLVLLIDGRSQDGIIQPSQNLKNMGIEIYAVGVKNAVEAELRQVASEPLEQTVYNLRDFTLLSSIVGRLSRVMCASIKNKEETVEELRNLSQAKSHRRHPSMAPEKPETFLRTTAADYILETKTTLATITEKSTQTSPHFQCDTLAATDIVLLVDGSWSVGRTNFKLIREFLAALVTPFNIAQDKTRVGLSQYSGDPRTEWDLNTYSAKDSLLETIRNLRYKGGNTLTGLALTHVLEQNLKSEAGARAEATKLLVLLTDGKSQDSVFPPAQALKNMGVEIFAVGVKNADEAELRQVASEPLELTVYNLPDFALLSSLVGQLTRVMCASIKGKNKEEDTGDTLNTAPVNPGDHLSPTNLVVRELTSRSISLTWNPPVILPKKYRVVYYPSRGGIPKEVVLDGTAVSVQLLNLTSQTEYLVSVFPIYENAVGDGLRGITSTLPLSAPSSLRASEISHNSLRLKWKPADGATQYLVLCSSAPNGAEDETKEVKVEQPEVLLEGLSPSTEYSLAVYAMYGEDASDPASVQETTLGLSPPQHLHFSDISHGSVRVNWEVTLHAMKAYRVTYISSRGSNTGEVEVPGNVSSVVLKPLSSLTQYFVSLISVYEEGDSFPVTGNVTTLKVPPPSRLKVTELSGSEVRLEWEVSAASDVIVYQIKWNALGEDSPQELSVAGNLAAAILPGLKKNTEYQMSIWAYYKDGARSDTVSVWHRMTAKNPPTDLFVDSETPTSLQVHWSPPEGAVQHYRLTYTPERGDKHQDMITVSGRSRTITLHALLPATAYSVSLSAVYATGESDPVSAVGQTASPLARLPMTRGLIPFKTQACPPLDSMEGSLQGFDMMGTFGLMEKEYASIRGVAMEPYVFLGTHTYTLFRDIQLTRKTSVSFWNSSGIHHHFPPPTSAGEPQGSVCRVASDG